MKKKAGFIFEAVVLLCLSFTLGAIFWWNIPKAEAAPHTVSYKKGHATWYNLCNGHNGACGDCDNNKMHAAWPHLPQTGCYRYCSDVGSLSCGSRVTVSDRCPGRFTAPVEIHDCCTCNGPGGCNGQSRCDGSIYNTGDVIIDLTSYAFLHLHGNLGDGRIPVTVYY